MLTMQPKKTSSPETFPKFQIGILKIISLQNLLVTKILAGRPQRQMV